MTTFVDKFQKVLQKHTFLSFHVKDEEYSINFLQNIIQDKGWSNSPMSTF